MTKKSKFIKLGKVHYSKCLGNCDIKSRIVDEKIVDSTLYLKIGVHLNCAGNFESKAYMESDSLFLEFNLKADENRIITSATCNCFFQIDLTLNGINEFPKEIVINKQTFLENFATECKIIIIDENDTTFDDE